MPLKHTYTVADYLLERLEGGGADHVFGIPGDFILPFFEVMARHGTDHVATCNELNAGYAADGYARLKGLGAIAVTYGPGAFSLINAVAGAYAERVPLVVISGGPRLATYRAEIQPALHHVLPDKLGASMAIFYEITTLALRLDDPQTAPERIDQALEACLRDQRPVYLEIPSDLQQAECTAPGAPLHIPPKPVDERALGQALELLASRVVKGKRTVLLPGHEVHRQQLQNSVRELVGKTGMPVASMFTGKADYAEQWPECIGLYMGAGSCREVSRFVEAADTVIFLGAVPSDFNLGGSTAQLQDSQVVLAYEDRFEHKGQRLDKVPLGALLVGLIERLPQDCARVPQAPRAGFIHRSGNAYVSGGDLPISNKRFYDRMAHFIRNGDIVLADAGAAVNSAHIQLAEGAQYQTSTYWAAIGMGFGASLGACFATGKGQRVIVLEGDGSFQMSAQELGTMTRYSKTPLVFVINNLGYTAERLIHDGPFNDIAPWKYHRLADAWGGRGVEVRTEADLERVLSLAESWAGPGPLLIEVHMDPWDASEAFRLMSEGLRTP